MYLDLRKKKGMLSKDLLPKEKKKCAPAEKRPAYKVSKEAEILITNRDAMERRTGIRIEGLGIEGAEIGVVLGERGSCRRKVSLYDQLVKNS